jgi:hypothetical protein
VENRCTTDSDGTYLLLRRSSDCLSRTLWQMTLSGLYAINPPPLGQLDLGFVEVFENANPD